MKIIHIYQIKILKTLQKKEIKFLKTIKSMLDMILII